MQTTAGKQLLTVRETAAYLGIQPQTLACWRCTGRYPALPYVKMGRLVRYRLEDVEAFLESQLKTHTGS